MESNNLERGESTYKVLHNMNIDIPTFQKMFFIFNALNDGWSIKKRKDSYVFTKKHEGRKEILSDDYLITFIKNNNNTI